MSDPLRENGPVLLVPSAWSVVAGAHTGAVSDRALLIAHVVMATILFVFAVVSWEEMNEGVLRVWRAVLVGGFFMTVAGSAGLVGVVSPAGEILLAVSLYGWMLAPAAGLAYTARESETPYAYTAGAALSVLGASVYAAGSVSSGTAAPQQTVAVVAVAVVGVGQTVGIADAVYRY